MDSRGADGSLCGKLAYDIIGGYDMDATAPYPSAQEMQTETVSPQARPVPVQKRLVLVNAGSAVVGQLVHVGLLVWLQQYLLARVPLAEYAVYPVVLAPMLLVPLLVNGITLGVGRFVVLHLNAGDGRGVTEVASAALPFAWGLAALVALAGGAVLPSAAPLLGIGADHAGPATLMLGLLLGLAVVRIAAAPLTVGPFVRQRFVLQSALVLGTQAVRVLLVVGLLLGLGPRVLWVVVGTVIAELIGLVAVVAVTRRLVPGLTFRRALWRRDRATRVVAFGGWSVVKDLAMVLRRAAVPVLLLRLAGPFHVACYHLGALVMHQIEVLLAHAMQPLVPPLVAVHAGGETARLRSLYLRGSRYGLWLAFLLVVPLVLYREELTVRYVGTGFLPAGTTMALLVLHLPLRLGNAMLLPLAPATGNLRPWARAALATQVAAVTLMGLAVAGGHGATGAAWASLAVTAVAQPLLHWPIGRRLAGASFADWLKDAVLPALPPLVAGGAAWIVLRAWLLPRTWPALIGCIAAGALVYLAVLTACSLKEVDRGDLRVLVRALRGRSGAEP